MNFELSEEQVAIRDTIRELVQDRVAPRAAEIDEKAEYPKDIERLFAENAVLGEEPFDVLRVFGLLVDLGRARRYPVLHELSDRVSDRDLLLGELEVHQAEINLKSNPSPKEVPGDDDALHLVRALVDLQRFGVADVTLEWAARHRALLAGELKRVQRELHGGIRAVELRHRGLARERAPGAAEPCGVVSEQLGRLEP